MKYSTHSVKVTALAITAALLSFSNDSLAQITPSPTRQVDCAANITIDTNIQSHQNALSGSIRNLRSENKRHFDVTTDDLQKITQVTFIALNDACHLGKQTFCRNAINVVTTKSFDGEIYSVTQEIWPCK